MKKVKKVWGYEVWLVNREYCGKLLVLYKGFQCSLHYHKEKDETFYVNSGKVSMEIGKKKWTMKKGDVQRIAPGKLHRFTGLEKSEIIEFSTHHKESDSYRIEPSRRCKKS